MHEGHRKRMLERLENGEESLQDHELLEILLYNALPRVNTNGLAHRLLAVFGSLDGVFHAPVEELAEIEGIGMQTAAYLRVVGLCFSRTSFCPQRPPEIFNVETFSKFLAKRYAGAKEECLELYCLDGNDRVRHTKCYTSEERERVIVSPDSVMQFLSAHSTKGLVAAHNHPGKPCAPTAEDDRFTAQLQLLCSMNNIRFYDHVIVGEDGHFSYRLAGKMDDIGRVFHISNILGGIK